MEKIKAALLPNILERALSLHRSQAEKKDVSYQEMTDEHLVEAVRGGEERAFMYLVQRYEGKLFAYIMRLINHRDDACDITQDVFLKAYRNLHRFDTERKFSSWIYRIAHNESVNWLKKKTRAKVESLESQVEKGLQIASKSDVFESYARKEEQIMVRKAIDALPEKYRVVMELRYLDERSYEEISQVLAKPVNTVGTLINRAKKRLLSQLENPS